MTQLNQIDDDMDELMSYVHTVFIEDETVMDVVKKYESRSNEGMKTYGTSLRNNGAPLEFWIESAIEEAMDITLYLQRLLEEVKRKSANGG